MKNKLKLPPETVKVLLAFADELEQLTKQHFEERYREEKRYHVMTDRARRLKSRGKARHAVRSWQ